jgi:hypothetical protein
LGCLADLKKEHRGAHGPHRECTPYRNPETLEDVSFLEMEQGEQVFWVKNFKNFQIAAATIDILPYYKLFFSIN